MAQVAQPPASSAERHAGQAWAAGPDWSGCAVADQLLQRRRGRRQPRLPATLSRPAAPPPPPPPRTHTHTGLEQGGTFLTLPDPKTGGWAGGAGCGCCAYPITPTPTPPTLRPPLPVPLDPGGRGPAGAVLVQAPAQRLAGGGGRRPRRRLLSCHPRGPAAAGAAAAGGRPGRWHVPGQGGAAGAGRGEGSGAGGAGGVCLCV